MSIVEESAKAARGTNPTDVPRATLAEVDIRSELDARPLRAPNYEREHQAFAVLAAEMADNPRNMLQKLVEVAVDLCGAHTAGLSLLDGDVFRWEAVAGVFACARESTMPRDQCPCGICIDRDATQLMHLPDRCFPALYAEPRFVEALLIPFHDHAKPVGTVWVVSHSPERKFDREDERIVRVLAEFASAGWQLWKAYDAAAEANRRKDAFLATLGHELRNPLAALTMATSILEQRVTQDDRAVHAIEVIARQCRHVARLANDLLDTGRISSGKLQLDVKLVDLWTVVSEAVEISRPKIEHRGLQLTVDLGDTPVWVKGDPVRLAQMFGNLIDNATKYTPPGGRIAIAGAVDSSEVGISISDTGSGIPGDQLHRIFEPFTQLRESLESSEGGLGLGLSLVRSLAELHGGAVSAQSRGPGQGSCFTVRLPVLPPV